MKLFNLFSKPKRLQLEVYVRRGNKSYLVLKPEECTIEMDRAGTTIFIPDSLSQLQDLPIDLDGMGATIDPNKVK